MLSLGGTKQPHVNTMKDKTVFVEQRRFGTTDALMLLAIMLWAVNLSFIKVALREFSPIGFNGLRLPVAAVGLLLIWGISREKFAVPRSDLWKLALLGLCGNTLCQFIFIQGFDMTTASNTAIIIGMSPVFIALLSGLLKHEKMRAALLLGISVSFVGFYLVITSRTGAVQISHELIKGDLLVFSGNFFWVLYTVFSKPLLQRISPLQLSTVTMVFGAIFFIPFSIKEVLILPYGDISFQAWACLIFSGIFSLGICYVIWYASVRRVGNSRTAIYDNLLPVFSVFFAYIFLNERITLVQGGGALIIFLGIYLARFKGRVGYKKK